MESKENTTNNVEQPRKNTIKKTRIIGARVPIEMYEEVHRIAVEKNYTMTDVIYTFVSYCLKKMKED